MNAATIDMVNDLFALIDTINDVEVLEHISAKILWRASEIRLRNTVLAHGGTEETIQDGFKRNLEAITGIKGE